jgi:putative transposase
MSSQQTHHLASKIKLYPNKEQEILFRKTVGSCRFIYNYYLAFKLKDYERYKKYLKKGKDPKLFKWKKLPTESSLKEQYEWLREIDSTSLQQSRVDLETAFKNYHKHGFGNPKFHKKGRKESFRIPNGNKDTSIRIENNKIKIGKLGFLKFRSGKLQEGKIKNITVSCEANCWYASILYEVPSEKYYKPKDFKYKAIGIDLGVVKPLTIVTDTDKSTFIGVDISKKLKEKEIRRKRYQRSLSRKQKGSNNFKKTKIKIQKAYQKERNIRKEFIETTSYKLANNSGLIIFEDLKIRNMTRSAKGTLEEPGTNVKAKSGLNREMLRLGLSNLVKRTQDKSFRFGSQVRFVDPKFTSQTCSDCGAINKKSRKSQSRFECLDCSFIWNADKNAAKNILMKGMILH